jgi:hypothetical protein
MVLFVNCSVNNPEVRANKEYFIGNWKSNALLERIEFTATNAKWFINYKKDTTITLETNSIFYDIYDSTYLVMHFKGWELYSDKSRIDFLDTFTLSSGKIGNGASIFEYSIQSENSFYLKGIDSEPILFARD